MGKDDRSVPAINEDGFTINGCSFNVNPKYKPIDAIGQGSYGVVCSVRNTETDEKLAIKKITPMAGDEWDATHTLREIRLMRCLGAHENIISLKDLSMCKEKDELYMMMELADTDLHRLIQSSCPLTEGHIRVIMYQVLSGVKAMHDNGVLHRDLKPGNLLLNKDCELKITDFGLARMMPKKAQLGPEQASNDGVSMMTEYVVTRWYRPPELMLAPNGSYDGAVDMWSVGCILGELVSRKPLFPGTDFMDQLTRVFQVLPVPEPEDRGYVIEKDALKFLSSLPAPVPGALETKLGEAVGLQALDLLRRLLCFNPKERISADNALMHPFFDGVQEEWGEITPLHLPHSLEFAFETQSLPLSTLRQYICDEVLAFADRASKHPPEPHEKEPQTKTETPTTSNSENNNDTPSVLENDCPVGSGFTLKGCDFNVPAKYKPLQVLGEGSYGIVCAATNTETKKNVAIKKITPMAGDEWDAKHTLREIRLMRYFGKHPNIASLQDLSTCIEKDELYLMMDLVDTDLHRLIQSKTKLEEAHIAAIMYQLLCGAQTLHENGVLHRDLKPGNILVSKNCDVKITDFGLSRYIPHSARNEAVKSPTDVESRRAVDKTQALMTEYVVTRWYRPPEIMLAPTGVYNEAVDMWSVGCIFGELLNRRPMFPGSDFLDQLSRVFSVLPVPTRDKRGYEVEGDALAFLESLPPCSPSALTKLFRRASPEAVSLLRRLLCVNPARRISAKQALAHPYFKSIRAQLGEPPVFRVDKAFDFEFDYQEFSLTHLKTLIQSEVKLLQKYGLPPPIVDPEPVQAAVYEEVDDYEDEETKQEIVGNVEQAKTVEPTPAVVTGPEHGVAVSKTNSHAEPETDEPASTDSEPDAKYRQQQDEETEAIPQKKPATVEPTKQINDDGDKPRRTTKTSSARSEPTTASSSTHQSSKTTTSSSLARPKSTGTTSRRSNISSGISTSRSSGGISYRSKRDDDEVSSVSSISSNNRHSNNNGLDSVDRGGKWGHSRSSVMASTASSRLHRSSHSSSTSSIHERRSGTVNASSMATRTGSARVSSSNQRSARGDESVDRESVKSDSVRGPERVSASSTLTAATASSLRRQTSSAGAVRTLSARKESLPEGWIRRIHSKSGREYFYDTLNKVASWKLPVKKQQLDNIFAGTSSSSTSSSSSRVAYGHRQNVQVTPGTSSTASSPSSAMTPESQSSRSSMLSSRRTGSSTSSNLPKEWARRTDPKTGRLFYVNLVTNRAYAKLPSSVTAAMLNLGREAVASKRAAAEALSRKKSTVPHSPQFSQMSWQRKRVPNTDD
ncbi:CMGC/MAPK protein kinase [Phytophthora nicotianae]|uniref:CMGC/MAPK protein kinase n=1 Tax=Phytophthora nicotianae TaxID=4792 RepID=W2P9S3_PHYNI|nr:CMGC/MAPK protein kinase [Phytophthora nicotianae]